MSKLFGKLKTEGLEEAGDRLGGGTSAVPTDVYDATIKVAYAGQSQGGAHSVTLLLDVDGQEVRSTQWVTNKAGENFYPDKQDSKKKHPLPGYTLIDDICLLVTGEELAEQDSDTKVVNIYDFEQKKEVPTEVPVLTALTGAKITLGILRVIEPKQKKDSAGVYKDTDETRTVNEIDKAFHPETKRTVTEYRHGVETPEFHTAWKERNAGKDRNKAGNGSAGGGAAGSGRPGNTNAPPAAKKKLFG